MKKSEVVDRVQELVSDKSGAMRQLVGSWVDIVLQDLSSRALLKPLKVEESTPLIVGQAWYALPPSADQIFKMFVPAWGEEGILTKKSDDEYLHYKLQNLTPGRPCIYNIFGVSNIMAIRIHPVPDIISAPDVPTENQKLFVWMYKSVETLGENDEIVEIKPKHIPLLIYGAYSMGAVFDSVLTAADSTAKYERGIVRLGFDNNLDLNRPSQVRYQDV